MRRHASSAAALLATLVVALACLGLTGSPAVAAPARHHHHKPACLPPAPQQLSQAVHSADAIFAGKIVGLAGRTASVTVGTMVKGSPGSRTKVLFPHGWDCGATLRKGATYAFFVLGSAGSYRVDAGLPTSSANVDKTIADARALLAPPAPSVSFSEPLVGRPIPFVRLMAPGAAAVVIGLIGLLVVRLRRAA